MLKSRNKTYFISDCHLSADRPHVIELFERFISDIHGSDALYILGDLFDVWVGDDNLDACAHRVIQALKALHASGTNLYCLKGNRDFLLGKTFAQQAHWQMLSDYHVIEPYGHRVLLCHGDTLCSDDKAYLRFRKVVRNPIVLFFYRRLPLFYRKRIAQKLRQKSMSYQKQVSLKIIDVTAIAVKKVMARFKTKVLIHGHTHRPKHHLVNNQHRYVLGDWHEHSAKILQLDNQGFKLFDYARLHLKSAKAIKKISVAS